MKIALAQMKVIPGIPELNIKNMLEMIKEAKKKKVNLIIFPEMCVGGYLLGDKWTDDEFCENLMAFNETLREASEGIAIAYGNVYVDKEINKRTKDNEIHLNKDGRNRKYNAVYVFQNRKPAKRVKETDFLPEGVQPKTLLPNYRIFDDERYFSSLQDVAEDFNIKLEEVTQPFELEMEKKNVKVGLELCEDLWCEDYRRNLKALNPTKILIDNGAEIICNLSASPWTYGKNAARDRRILFLKKESGDNFIPFLYVNCTGVQNNGKNIVTFDGGSTVYNKEGLPIIFSKVAYQEELIIIDESDFPKKPEERKEKFKIAQKYEALIEGIRYFKDMAGLREHPRIVIGMSGGIDSSLVTALCVKALGKDKVIGVNMPFRYNIEKTKKTAEYVAKKLGIKYIIIPIEKMVEINKKIIDNADIDKDGKKLSELNMENIQAKIRATSLLSNLASKYNAVFTNNGNKLEIALGYATLYGDIGGALAPIGDLTKIEILELAKFMNKEIFHDEIIPETLFPDKLWRFKENQIQPSAELKSNQIDPMKFVYHCALLDAITDYKKKSVADIMHWFIDGILHEQIDFYLKDLVGENIGLGLMKRWNIDKPEEFIKDIEWFCSLIQKNIFKRVQAPPIIITSKSAYGYDIRESMFPYSPTIRQEQLKKYILSNIKEYKPK